MHAALLQGAAHKIMRRVLGRKLSTRRYIMSAIFLLSVSVFLLYRPLSEPEGGDASIYDYISQSILRGQLPYRDVADRKTPGQPYLSALAMRVGALVGLRDIIASRILHILLGATLCASTFWVADAYLGSRVAGMIAVTILLMSGVFAEWTVGGGQPKLPMAMFGMLTLVMIAKDRPFWAGAYAMMSCLCWQPGLLFAGTAFLMASRYLTSWRDFRALKVVIGAAIPLVVMLLYFYSTGILGYCWSYAFEYNYLTFRPIATRDLSDAVQHIWKVALRVFRVDIFLVVLSLAGLTFFTFERSKTILARIKSSNPSDWFRDALLIPPLVYLGFCLINFQSGPDLIPLFPFIGIFAAYLLFKASNAVARSTRVSQLALPVVLAGLISVVVVRAVTYRPDPSNTLASQDEQLQMVSMLLGPDDKVYAQGRVEFLVLLNIPNINPYIDLDFGMDDYVAARWYGGSFDRFIDELESGAPKVVSITRIAHMSHGPEMERWLATHYEKLPVEGFDLYFRKQM